MAVLSGNRTLLDLANVKDPDGTLAAIAEVLTKDNEILLDAVWQEANDTFSHRITRRTSLPAGSWRQLNGGVATEKSATKTVVEGIGMLDSIAKTDVELVNAAPNPAEFRMQEAASFLEGMSQTLATTLIYGNASLNVEQFTGLAVRMPELLSTSPARTLGNGGTGSDVTSIYIVQWGLDKVFMAYPKGSQLGIEHDDRGIDLVLDGSSNTYRAYIDYFSLKCGLVVRDDRCIGRSANIESSGSSNIFDADNIIKITNEMPMRGAGAALYMNTTVLSQLEIQAKDKTNVNYGPADAFGRPTLMFRSHPVRLVDAIVNTETAIS